MTPEDPFCGRSRTAGFTLVELLVVIAVIAVLAALLFPVFVGARESAKQAQCSQNCKQWGAVLAMYTDDYETLPPRVLRLPGSSAVYWTSLVQPYVRNKHIRWCPSKGSLEGTEAPEEYKARYQHYGFNAVVGVSMQPAYGPEFNEKGIKPSEIRFPTRLMLIGESFGGSREAWAYRQLTKCESPTDIRWCFHLIYPDNNPQWAVGKTAQQFTDVARHNGGFNALFADGHVRRLTGDEVYPSKDNPRIWFPGGVVPEGYLR